MWQALQRLPFAIWGVASAVHIVSKVIAIDRTNTITVIAAVRLIVKRISSSGTLALTDVCSFGYSDMAYMPFVSADDPKAGGLSVLSTISHRNCSSRVWIQSRFRANPIQNVCQNTVARRGEPNHCEADKPGEHRPPRTVHQEQDGPENDIHAHR